MGHEEEERARECTKVWIAVVVVMAIVALFIFFKMKSELKGEYRSLFNESFEEED